MKLDLPGEDGVSLRAHLTQVFRDTKVRPAELDELEIPRAGAHLWAWFWDLDGTRSNAGGAAQPITFAELAAWRDLSGETVRPWEVRALKTMDEARLRATAEETAN